MPRDDIGGAVPVTRLRFEADCCQRRFKTPAIFTCLVVEFWEPIDCAAVRTLQEFLRANANTICALQLLQIW